MKKFSYLLNLVLCSILLVIIISYLNLNKESKLKDTELKNKEIQIEKIEEEHNRLIVEVDELVENRDKLESEKSYLENIVEENERLIDKSIITDYGSINILEDIGIDNLGVIEEDLMNKPQLIGIEGVLGGIMRFERIYVLNEKYAYAYFCDGHIVGYGIYRYHIEENLEINWATVLEGLIGS